MTKFSFLHILFCLGLYSFEGYGQIQLSKKIYQKAPFSTQYSNDGAIILNSNFKAVKKLIPQLEKKYGVKLSHRGEAHITLITPPEGKTGFFKDSVGLDQVIKTKEIIKRYKDKIQNFKFDVKCIGRQTNKNGNTVFYLVVESQDIIDFRKEIEKIVKQSNNKEIKFSANKSYYPHITIGFVKGDVHGVSKGLETCVDKVSIIE